MNEILWVDTYDIEKKIIDKDDHILAIGGDGTLLKAINKYKHLNKPFFGYAKGTINFLMNQETEPINNCKFKKFNLIRVQVTTFENNAQVVRTFQAFNDIVLGAFNGWINFNCTHRDNILGNFWGSGIVISTAQGSTGINKNNYGTILPLTSKNWSVTGMQCNRVINYVLEPKTLTIDISGRESVMLYIDGKNNIINDVISITVSKGDKVTCIFNNYQRFKEKRQ